MKKRTDKQSFNYRACHITSDISNLRITDPFLVCHTLESFFVIRAFSLHSPCDYLNISHPCYPIAPLQKLLGRNSPGPLGNPLSFPFDVSVTTLSRRYRGQTPLLTDVKMVKKPICKISSKNFINNFPSPHFLCFSFNFILLISFHLPISLIYILIPVPFPVKLPHFKNYVKFWVIINFQFEILSLVRT